jgi:hypothetical protein
MNERIEELADQCWSKSEYDPSIDPWFNHRRFASLLIKECIDTVLDSSVEYATRSQIAQELKEHFGVSQ